MPDWLHNSLQPAAELSATLVAVRLLIALVMGSVVAGAYRLTHGKTASEPGTLSATLVLLTVIMGMVTLAIGNSIERAFSLVGALAIVRFRTVVDDTRDTAFVVFAVAVGLAVGAGAMTVPLVGIPITALAAFMFRPPAATAANLNGRLRIRVALGSAGSGAWDSILAAHLDSSRLVSSATARQGAALDLSYQVRLRRSAGAIEMVTELNRCEGIQEVEFRQE